MIALPTHNRPRSTPHRTRPKGANGALTDADQMAAAKAAYGWTTGPFEVPADVKIAMGRGLANAVQTTRRAWEEPVSMPCRAANAKEFNRALAVTLLETERVQSKGVQSQTSENAPKTGTRAAAKKTLRLFEPAVPEKPLVASADLTGSTNTQTVIWRVSCRQPWRALCLLGHPDTVWPLR